MAYYTEILTESVDGYRPIDLDMRDAATLDDLIEMMRNAGEAGEAVAVIEHEDEWFALVRLLADDEVRVFISDIAAAGESPYADIFADYLDSGPSTLDESEHFDVGPEHDADDDDADDEAEIDMFEPEADAVWGGDADIYADRDVPADELLEQVSRYQSDPARVVAHVGEKAGFADVLGSAG
ncbi:tRNA adenosine deaminase-associated protein [Brevibacterium sp. p3-SID960]|uniref:tRNA adenosine deaminase-associated protein n=1 Tax=Brevibacterium sp. p3-SID960 TaxID=2916063 RepID=UPI0021A5BDB5|nr:tRNA adenosine deaminase-associated protein [Brevibacterium sp. p3-SID960]MCT1689494.1 tRNA adenosine deaminase-associated protein [Brevibacterium sp. p3-SID960]